MCVTCTGALRRCARSVHDTLVRHGVLQNPGICTQAFAHGTHIPWRFDCAGSGDGRIQHGWWVYMLKKWPRQLLRLGCACDRQEGDWRRATTGLRILEFAVRSAMRSRSLGGLREITHRSIRSNRILGLGSSHRSGSPSVPSPDISPGRGGPGLLDAAARVPSEVQAGVGRGRSQVRGAPARWCAAPVSVDVGHRLLCWEG
jgi:hypothetical protein